MPPGRQQVVLASLLLDLNRIVSTDQLVDVIWSHDPPETARTQVQICVSRLRRLLVPTGAVIDTRTPGYLLRAGPEAVDVHLFRVSVRDAEILAREGRDEDAADCLREAVGSWRGPALSGLEGEILRNKAVLLDEERVAATEAYVDIELRLGRHARLLGELPDLVDRHPTRERLRAQLMLALYRSGRQADALRAYRLGRDLFIEELGLEPGTELRSLEASILRSDPALDLPRAPVPPAPPVPAEHRPADGPGAADDGPARRDREEAPTAAATPVPGPFQLPTAAADFVGRPETVAAVQEALAGGPGASGIAVLLGRPGVGKSATAVHIAHRLADEHFPEGQLYCDLRGSGGEPLTALNVLGRFLRALGVPGQAVPDDLDERSGMYRGIIASRRLLVVLDDAASEAQVLPLLPGRGGCGVLITSRARITGLPGAHRIELDILDESAALDLLVRVIGKDRVERERESARALVRSVGRLPLALRIAAARLAARPHWSVAAMVTRLSDERRRLDELAHGDMTVRSSLSLTYDGLDAVTARVFGLLSAAEGPTVPSWAAGALLDDPRPFPADLTEPLVDARMLDATGIDPAGEPVYRFHDLVREYAREKADEQGLPTPDGHRRLIGGWLALLEEANRRILGGNLLRVTGTGERWRPPAAYTDVLLADPHRWIDLERPGLLAAITQAARLGFDEQCWELASQFCVYAERRGYFDEFREILEVVSEAVRASGNRRGTAAMDFVRCLLMTNDRRPREADAALSASFDGFTEVGDRFGQGLCRAWMADSAFAAGDRAGARAFCAAALEDFAAVGETGAAWRPLISLGRISLAEDGPGEATTFLERALACTRETGDPRAQAQVLYQMALRDMELGEHADARTRFEEALGHVTRPGDPVGEALLHSGLGRALAAMGETGPACAALERSIVLWGSLGDREGEAQARALLERTAVAAGAGAAVSPG
ncbi:BTAD domain-containing putative transcriptional regulator [Nocardiopsis sp. DSM 44743]|uniref:BTAD domain-containing putative transcriptional regulator n=1 Tax=Nocardiopsis lambiniae TaxID=3075539 RepID=A0ABU2M671_9ACTN|nr:BTAD domain-containing putative transcriptional regulator [Nocardiopsis sp. DSM 44743]